MNILINGKFLGAPRTGVQRVAFELVRAMDRLKSEHDPAFADREFELTYPGGTEPDISLKATRLTPSLKLPGVLWEQFVLAWRSRKVRLLNICNSGPIFASNAVTMIHDAQVYLTPTSYSKPFRLWYKTMLPLMGHRHKAIVTVSEFSKQALVKEGVAPADKITVVHNGVDHILSQPSDPTVVRRLGLQPRGYVVALANVQAHKNINILIEAFRDERLTELSLILFGKASEADFNQESPLPSNIVFAGRISDQELRSLLENALCLGFPSLTEGFGLPALEAMLLGCPVVAAPCGALPEVCGKAVLYADPNAKTEWTDAFLALHGSTKLWLELLEKGRRQASRFTWERAARTLNAVLGT